jgi:hypothetical protein
MSEQSSPVRPGLVGFDRGLVERAVTGPGQLDELATRLAGARRVVVIAGTSIAGLVLAARLGAHARRGGDLGVVLVAGGPPVPRRLVAGCSLRWSTVTRMARAMSVEHDTLVERLGGRAAVFSRMAVEAFEPGTGQMITPETRDTRVRAPYVGLSTRHGHILHALRRSLDGELPVTLVDGDVVAGRRWDGAGLPLQLAGEEARLTLPADRTVVLNATSKPDLLRPGGSAPEPRRFVIAVQAACAMIDGPPRCGPDTSWAPSTAGHPAPHLAFFTPFADPQIPSATWYGINTMVVARERLDEIGREALVDTVSGKLIEYEEALGLREVDAEQTRAAAVVPVVRQSARAIERSYADGSPVVEVHKAFGSGAPAINVDGMLAATIGADAFATAFLDGTAGHPADDARTALAAADRALRPLRVRNALTEAVLFRAPGPLRRASTRMPAPLVRLYLNDFSALGA